MRCFVLFACLGLAAGSSGASEPEEAEVHAHFAAFANAWVKGDAHGVASSFADDADVVRPNQPLVVGRTAIEAFYAQMFTGPLKDAAKTTRVDRVRLVTRTVAVVDSSYTLDRDEPPLHAKGVSVSVLEKRDGRWLTLISRSYRLP